MKLIRTLFITLMFAFTINAQTWLEAPIDTTGAGGDTTDAFYLDNGQDEHIVAVSVDTPFVGTAIVFLGYDWPNGRWLPIFDYDATQISVTIDSVPGIYGVKPVWAFFLTDSLKMVSDSTETNPSALAYKKGKLE